MFKGKREGGDMDKNVKVGIFRTPFIEDATVEQKITMLGENTGNMVFGYALVRLLGTELVPYNGIHNEELMKKYDSFIITDLIWIRENSNFEYLNKILDRTDKPLVPISVGLQANSIDSDFKINDSTLKIIKRIEERATIGVRGEYTANVLEKHGIKKYSVIGCPSMYYWNNPELQINSNVSRPEKILSNFRTIYGSLTQKEKHFLSYSANLNAKFVEQTRHVLTLENVKDEKYFSYVSNWMKKNKAMYFTVDEWMEKTKDYDFSIGGRFHGNVISLWNNSKSLFLYVDSRTKELTDHFKLPAMNINEFDKEKSIEFYYEIADYSEFNKIYKKRFYEFKEFLKENNLKIDENIDIRRFAHDVQEKELYAKTRIKRDKFLIDKNSEEYQTIASLYNILSEQNNIEIIKRILLGLLA